MEKKNWLIALLIFLSSLMFWWEYGNLSQINRCLEVGKKREAFSDKKQFGVCINIHLFMIKPKRSIKCLKHSWTKRNTKLRLSYIGQEICIMSIADRDLNIEKSIFKFIVAKRITLFVFWLSEIDTYSRC